MVDWERVLLDEACRPEWKKLNSKELGISTSMIAKPTKIVLNGLRKKGNWRIRDFGFLLIST